MRVHRDDIDPVGVEREAIEHQSGKLVDERFAAPGRHDDNRVAPGEQCSHRLPLAGLEIVVTELLAQQ
jgi:hypothetical protein